jgi:hypothetical protein
MKTLSWALMLLGIVCAMLAFYTHYAPLTVGGLLLAWVGEVIPRSATHLMPAPPARPEVRRKVEKAMEKTQEKSA